MKETRDRFSSSSKSVCCSSSDNNNSNNRSRNSNSKRAKVLLSKRRCLQTSLSLRSTLLVPCFAKGDFEGAEYLFSQCCALLDAHEGEAFTLAYLTVDWAPCLNQLKRFDEATAVCERALRILEGEEYQQYEELTQVKIPVYHAAAVACVGLKKFAEGRDLIDACLDLIKGSDPYRAFHLAGQVRLVGKGG